MKSVKDLLKSMLQSVDGEEGVAGKYSKLKVRICEVIFQEFDNPLEVDSSLLVDVFASVTADVLSQVVYARVTRMRAVAEEVKKPEFDLRGIVENVTLAHLMLFAHRAYELGLVYSDKRFQPNDIRPQAKELVTSLLKRVEELEKKVEHAQQPVEEANADQENAVEAPSDSSGDDQLSESLKDAKSQEPSQRESE